MLADAVFWEVPNVVSLIPVGYEKSTLVNRN